MPRFAPTRDRTACQAPGLDVNDVGLEPDRRRSRLTAFPIGRRDTPIHGPCASCR